ncbi:serine/threonine protein kinase [Arthrobacter livingstonensis]|uniref:non-specific serine/threonine protein kinase n=1 Tax=Arthrobacter livingstonensis TaxID=670078 RepID=A0A2V5LXJ8_9MICC|nr:Stk1 family PASTA domain-containing Ser/Thr kinase [Arthrobacter livingstonensis]PYI67066.1 serine/threonine protein kinase [Arthrobacter livingstonensis]
MQDEPLDPLIGATIDDRYLVLAKVARGGMSTVYLAKDIRLNRNIALKILHPHLATDNAFIERLQREAWSAASLSHPHVVQIHDHGVGAAHAYLVLEYIDGHTLREVINSSAPLTPRQALDLLDPIVEGLAAAHAAGLVHRDVKPENVLISRSGWVKIGDFGLSRAVTTTTNTATLLGTVGYIAPELVNGDGGDARSDIYSAGIMLYELLTGEQPFRGKIPIAVAMQHVRDDAPPPSAAVPGLPAEMDELVRYMTEKDPDHRPANGASLLEDLRHIRRTLTPEELDAGGTRRHGNPAALSAATPGSADTEALSAAVDGFATPLGNPTEAIDNGGAGDQANGTTVIDAPLYPTSVIPAANRLYVDDAADTATNTPHFGAAGTESGAGVDHESAEIAPAGLSKREARAAAKDRAKAAARPITTLGSAHPRRRAAIWILVVAVLGLLLAAAGWFLALGPGALATVPNVHNKTVGQAQVLIQDQGFELAATSEVFNEKTAAGLVVDTDPTAGTEQRKFRGVTILVSRGPVLYPVAALAGKTLADAKAALAGGHLAVGAVAEAFDEKAKAGTVVSQNPQPGTEFRSGTKVDLVVSKGPKPIPVPSLVGRTSADAQSALKGVGLVAAVAPDQVNSATVPAGSVVSQSPGDGTLTAGGKVTLTISKGPKMVMVPDVVGKQVDAARAQLEALGFKVKVENVFGGFFGTVRFQDPQGVEAPEGSTVTLRVI